MARAAQINRKDYPKSKIEQDALRATTPAFVERLGDRLEGKGRTILYALAALLLLVALLAIYNAYAKRQTERAAAALGRAIETANAPVVAADTPPPLAGANRLRFTSEKERAERAVNEFELVAKTYGNPQRDLARYFAATNRLTLNRAAAITELQNLASNGDAETSALSKFALAEAHAADGRYDEAQNLYRGLLDSRAPIYPADTLNLRIATMLEKQGKRAEASDLYFRIAKEARERKGKDGKPVTTSAASREAAGKLQELDAARFAQLPPEPVTNSLL